MSKAKSIRRSPAEIQKILSDLQASGLSRAKFSTQSGIPLSSIHSWFNKAKAKKKSDSPKVFAVGTISNSCPAIEIELPGGEILRLGPGCQSQDLCLVLGELRRC